MRGRSRRLIELYITVERRQACQDVWRRKQAYRQCLQPLGRRVRCSGHTFDRIWTGHHRINRRAAEL
jgi:hypothetical protein